MRRESDLDQDTFVTTWRPLSSFGMPTTVTTKRRNRSHSRETAPMPYNKHFRYESNPQISKDFPQIIVAAPYSYTVNHIQVII